MNRYQVIGTAKQVAGDMQARLGRAIGSTRQRGKGLSLKLEGKAQSSYGDAMQAMDDGMKQPRNGQ